MRTRSHNTAAAAVATTAALVFFLITVFLSTGASG